MYVLYASRHLSMYIYFKYSPIFLLIIISTIIGKFIINRGVALTKIQLVNR